MKRRKKLTPLGEQEPKREQTPAIVPLRQPAEDLVSQTSKKGRGWSKKRKVILGLVFFLFLIIFIVPAEYVPGLRNLAWRMGMSPEDTQSRTFSGVFFSWISDGGRDFSSMGKNGAGISIFDRQSKPGFNAQGPQSGLLDLAAVNASLRARGQRADYLQGAYNGPEDESQKRAAYQGVGKNRFEALDLLEIL